MSSSSNMGILLCQSWVSQIDMEVVRTSKTNPRLWLFLTLLLPSIALRKSNIETETIKWIVFLKPASFQIFPVSMDWLKFTAPSWGNGWYGCFQCRFSLETTAATAAARMKWPRWTTARGVSRWTWHRSPASPPTAPPSARDDGTGDFFMGLERNGGNGMGHQQVFFWLWNRHKAWHMGFF